MEVDADAVDVFDLEAQVPDDFRRTCHDDVSEFIEEEDMILRAESEALELGFVRVELKTELVKCLAEVHKDQL